MAECDHDWQPVYDTDRDGNRVQVGSKCGKCGAYRTS